MPSSAMKKSILTMLLATLTSGLYPIAMTTKTHLVSEQKSNGLASYVLVIPSEDFNEDELLRVAHRYMAEKPEVKVLQLGIFTEDKAAHDFMGKNVFDITYALWRANFQDRAKKEIPCAAVLLKYGSSATLKVRYPGGKIQEIAVAGENVFHLVKNNVAVDLQHVSVVNQGFGKSRQLVPHFYFTVANPISQDEATRLAESIRDSIGVPSVVVHLREDQWFIFDAHYPWLNPFARTMTAVSESDAASSIEFLCQPAQRESCYQVSKGLRESR